MKKKQNLRKKRQLFHRLLVKLCEVEQKETIVNATCGVSSTSLINEECKLDQLIHDAQQRLNGRNSTPQCPSKEAMLRKWRHRCLLVLNERGISATPTNWGKVNTELTKPQFQWVLTEKQREKGIVNHKGLLAFTTEEKLKKLFNQLCAIRNNEKKAQIKNS